MAEYRRDLPKLPPRMTSLPLDYRGYPVPWFVAWIDGKPDFRIVDTPKRARAWNAQLCWLCGQKLGRYQAFVIGPMCGVNRISSEPPCHRDCAIYAAKACPFLTMPTAKRREIGLEDYVDPAGQFISRNPGVTLVWIADRNGGKDRPRPIKVDADAHANVHEGVLFMVGNPVEVHWYARGRKATRAEIDASVESGMPLLIDAAKKQGPDALAELEAQVDAFYRLLDQEAA